VGSRFGITAFARIVHMRSPEESAGHSNRRRGLCLGKACGSGRGNAALGPVLAL
jgi:hypothetical protein